MNKENLKSIIYISKRCPHCRKLLLLLQSKPDLIGSIQITCIDDEPFPKVIKSVPSMISNGEVWNADELFAALEGKGEQQGQQGQGQQGQGQQGQQGQATDELDGFFNNSGALGGGSLGFSTLDDSGPVNSSYFATIDAKDNPIDVENDGYIKKNKKTERFDSDYEKMMAERGEVGQGGMRMGGQGL